MKDVLVVSRVRVTHVDSSVLERFGAAMSKTLQAVKGYRSISWWQREGDPYELLVLTHFDSSESAERGFRALLSTPVLLEGNLLLTQPAELGRYQVEERKGLDVYEVPVAHCLSLSKRVSEPGMQDRLVQELQGIFGELGTIDGYWGHIIAHNVTLAEEISGIVFWKEPQAYRTSLPKHPLYEVSLFTRVQ